LISIKNINTRLKGKNMANLNNLGDCRYGETPKSPNKFGMDGVTTNSNIVNGVYVPPNYQKGTYDLSTSQCAEKESNYLASIMAESLSIAGGPVNIFPLLGVHNQGSTLDMQSDGYPLSSGTPSGFNVQDAFNVNEQSWRSIQTGTDVIKSGFIGYDFGVKKAWTVTQNPKDRYFENGEIRKQISTIRIKQSSDRSMRVTQARIEASDDGNNWTRVDVINFPDTNSLVSVGVRSVAAYNKWRIIPVFFNGISNNQPWEVVELHFLESSQMSLDNIEDFILLENRDRAYCRSSTMIKCTYDLLDVQSELARFGITLPQTYIFTCSFADMVRIVGRPVIVGDIVELPGEIQFDANLRPVRKWLEITDTGWSTDGYTQNWRPNLFRFYAQPILPSVEHKDVLGAPGKVTIESSDDDFILDKLLQNDQAYDSTEAFEQSYKDSVPLTGQDPQNIQSGKPLIGNGEYDGNDLYVEDALPPNGEDFTIGDKLPDAKDIKDGHYHRQTYELVDPSLRPPDRLLRWSAEKGRWTIIEINTRFSPQSHKKTIAGMMSSGNKFKLDKKI
jgi:hypothetical protein